MRTNEIIREIQSLPLLKRIYVIEKAIHSIRSQEDKNMMKQAMPEINIETQTKHDYNVYQIGTM